MTRACHGATSTSPDPRGLRVLMVLLAVLLLGADQFTKCLAETRLRVGGEPIQLFGDLLTWQLYYNPGAAFGMGPGFTVALTLLAWAVLIGVAVLVMPRVRTWLVAVAVGWLLAGVAGNLADRLFRAPGPFHGYVVDFIALRGFAIFNVADMCITGAAGLMIIGTVRAERRGRR